MANSKKVYGWRYFLVVGGIRTTRRWNVWSVREGAMHGVGELTVGVGVG